MLIEIVFLRIMKMKQVKSWLKKLIRFHFNATSCILVDALIILFPVFAVE